MIFPQLLHFLYKLGISSIALSCFRKEIYSGASQHCLSRVYFVNHSLHSDSVNNCIIFNKGSDQEKMIQAFFLCLLLIYYWYFYASPLFQHIPKPHAGSPSDPPKRQFQFDSKQPNHFRFLVDGKPVWEHMLPVDTFTFHRDKIVQKDPCYGYPNHAVVPAKGKVLYDYLKSNSDTKNILNFKENSSFTVQEGNVFYFKCMQNHVDRLQMCPSGTILTGNRCQAIDSCTGKKDGTVLPDRISSRYIVCMNGKEMIKKCPPQMVFHHNRCESMDDLNHYCQYFSAPLQLDDETRLECRDGKPFYITCKSGTKFIDNDYCEPANCIGLPDGTNLPLPERKTDLFKFSPGYMTCRKNKIHEIVECSQNWDESLSKGENLLSLPMVFDPQSNQCSVPTFCENVFSDDPDVIVPVYEFTRHVKNWKFSEIFDRAAGFVCENKTRKRKLLSPDKRISKRFKEESACGPEMPEKLPIFNNSKSFYDCTGGRIETCPPQTFFNGSACIPEPVDAFKLNDLPLFKFDSLNLESWIKPFDYSKTPLISCQEPESTLIELYNICSHPDCSKYAFVSQIPDMAILLPREQQAKCKFYENERLLKKESVDFDYHFWSQKISNDEKEKPCQVGQKLQTGNFIWDSTVYATCNLDQPFVFCPSTHSQRILSVPGGYFACEPPSTKSYVFNIADWTLFETNEIKHIWPAYWNINDTKFQYIRRSKAKKQEILTLAGLDIKLGERLNLLASQPVRLEPRYRVTYPPNVAFEYDDRNSKNVQTSTPNHGFMVKLKNFTSKPLNFATHRPILFVESFDHLLYV